MTAQKVVSEGGGVIIPLLWAGGAEVSDLDVSLRGAVYRASSTGSAGGTGENAIEIDRRRPISTRCQPDPVGRKLDAVVEDCVNAVGVDLNTASVPLLTRRGLTRA